MEWQYRRARGWWLQHEEAILEGVVAFLGMVIFYVLMHVVKV